MTMTRVGNQTNSTDPHSVNSRVFVGNLNTYVVGKEEVERIFGRYGRVIGISMHKGYAFVQYTDAWDARNAVVGEDGRTVAGQLLDVNMVSEPKPHQINRKRQIFNSTAAAATPTFVGLNRQTIPPMKKQRTELLGFPAGPRPMTKTPRLTEKQQLSLNALYSNGEPDILICGNCKEVFPGIHKLIEHKKQGCKLRFSCRCQHGGGTNTPPPGAPSRPVCARCQSKQNSWWDLVQHFQSAHGSSLYVNEENSSSTNNMECEEGGAHSQSSGELTNSGSSSLAPEANRFKQNAEEEDEEEEEEEGEEDDSSNSTSDSRTGMPEFEIFENNNGVGASGQIHIACSNHRAVDANQVAEDKAVDTTDLQTLPVGEG